MWHGVPFACQRRLIVGVMRMCWLLPGSFDCFCCPHTSVHRPSIACLAVFLCGPGALFLHALSGPSTICPFPPHGWSAPDGLPLLLRKQPIWAAGDTPHLMPVEQGLPWHPVATGLAGQAIPFIVAASHAHALPSAPFWFSVPAVPVASPASPYSPPPPHTQNMSAGREWRTAKDSRTLVCLSAPLSQSIHECPWPLDRAAQCSRPCDSATDTRSGTPPQAPDIPRACACVRRPPHDSAPPPPGVPKRREPGLGGGGAPREALEGEGDGGSLGPKSGCTQNGPTVISRRCCQFRFFPRW